MSNRRTPSVSVGHDAFLDIVANLVGILIILVVVLGSQSQAIISESLKQDETAEKTQEPIEVLAPSKRVANEQDFDNLVTMAARSAEAQADSDRLERAIKQMDARIAQKAERRTILLALLNQAESVWKEEQSKLQSERQVAIRRQQELEDAESKLRELQSAGSQLKNAAPEVKLISHLPTPMARTVFGEEVHFRLKANRLSMVPMKQLMKEFELDARRIASGSRRSMINAAVGPNRGYVARYVLNRNQTHFARSKNRSIPSHAFLVAFQPLHEPYGAPVDRVLESDDWLDIELAGKNPATTTVTVWIYPDSFANFRRLKENLYKKGFMTAARPLSNDDVITVSSSGSKSTAQ